MLVLTSFSRQESQCLLLILSLMSNHNFQSYLENDVKNIETLDYCNFLKNTRNQVSFTNTLQSFWECITILQVVTSSIQTHYACSLGKYFPLLQKIKKDCHTLCAFSFTSWAYRKIPCALNLKHLS